VAWTVLANTWFDSGRFAEAERAFRELDARIAADDPERTEIRERLAASVYRQAEARQAAGDVEGAVGEFLRVASLVPDSTIRAKAEFDAATLLLNAKQWERAAQVLEAFRSAHPQHELAPDATRKLAVAYLESGRTQQAAIELERVATLAGEDGEMRSGRRPSSMPARTTGQPRRARIPPTSSTIPHRPPQRSTRGRRSPTWPETPGTRQDAGAGSRR
jgi:outer membrane protein assembly factor BamD (BamD/ComL family)